MGSAAEFQAMVYFCDLISSPSQGRKYTWSNNRRHGNVSATLDRSFFNFEWLHMFHDCAQSVLQRSVSDHAPLLIRSEVLSKPNNIPFRFHKFWMDHSDFLQVVQEVWKDVRVGCPILGLAQNPKKLKPILKSWAKTEFPNFYLEKDIANSELDAVQSLIEHQGMNEELFSKEADAKTRLFKAMESHEKLWSEKARIRWMKRGDRNSKFFHLSIKVRRAKNMIRNLKREDGSMTTDSFQLPSHVSDFYENFHKCQPTIDHFELLDCVPKEISDVDQSMLDSIPTSEEIKRAVWDLDPDSSPGPNGFPGAFFRKCRDIVGNNFCGAVKSFFRSKNFPRGVNNSFLTLIPKVQGANSLNKYCPICMANFFYKALSKIMASRVSDLLPRLVSLEKGAFQRGKIISANIGLASELENLMHSSICGGGMGIKLDIQKVFDTLSWNFLFATLQKFGF
ncbi:uncharacterized protein LOC122063608 [Macadamia integrifolia]|uniref:uncharacterized protein LOC122063608 n=1 Tax=Macadamia integrifolia TaxID=60698 RepID=UPI001C4E5393|nr:uncharacterized protein LOC122063608 [Macadamia integrifolia]